MLYTLVGAAGLRLAFGLPESTSSTPCWLADPVLLVGASLTFGSNDTLALLWLFIGGETLPLEPRPLPLLRTPLLLPPPFPEPSIGLLESVLPGAFELESLASPDSLSEEGSLTSSIGGKVPEYEPSCCTKKKKRELDSGK